MLEGSRLFALDIGTRSIVGIMLDVNNDETVVQKVISKEHTERAMLDGQIHDVMAVAKLIQEVKQEMESFFGPLSKAYVAAAGRSLKTEQARVSLSIKGRKLHKEDITHIELMAVQQAENQMKDINQNPMTTHYFCVGYSVLYYYLDGEKIGNLIDQSGDEASVEIIATFLPKVVVDSLATALKRCGLEMAGLTLEPIAAIQVLIPPSIRRLNVALVDIGAGTSDIAITDQGTVINYGMVPVAGDEITEAISDHYLLDFPLAEQAKIQITSQESITIQDILGFEQVIEREAMIQAISPSIDALANKIVQEIFRLNHNYSPKAVMLIGGGSLTPCLDERVAELLNLPKNRVAIRGIEAIDHLHFAEESNYGPELITPIGIGITANKNPIQYKTINVNDMPLRIFEIKPLTVGESLLQAGIKMSQLYGKPGLAKIITVNGKRKTLSGQFGSPPLLVKNGKPCRLDDEVLDGDEIIAEKGMDGNAAELTISELLHEPEKKISINGESYVLKPNVKVNGQEVDWNYSIYDRDDILIEELLTIGDVFSSLHRQEDVQPFVVEINNRKITLPSFSGKIVKNGRETTLQDSIRDGDELEFVSVAHPTLEEVAVSQNWQLEYSIPVFFNNQEIRLTKSGQTVYRNEQILTKHDQIASGDHLLVEQHAIHSFIFQDLFLAIDFSPPSDASKQYQLLKNDQPTTFYDAVQPGDKLEIKWIEGNQLKN